MNGRRLPVTAVALLAALLAVAIAGGFAAEPPVLVQRDAYVMGTRALLAAYAAGRASGLAVLESALDVIEETEAHLSTWRDGSAISRFNRAPVGHGWTADPALCRLFGDLYDWHERTAGAFDPAIGALAEAWQIHGEGQVPGSAGLGAARARTGLGLIDFDREACALVRRADATIDVGAFGKGEALDRVAQALSAGPWIVDLGGQIAVGGRSPDGSPWVVDVAHPIDRQRPIIEVQLSSGSLSTSGGSERDRSVGGTRIAHHLDPRTGTPAAFTGSVVVWHERALVADIVSTALYVMGPEQGVRWAESNGITAAYLIPMSHGVATVPTSTFARLKPDFLTAAR